MNNLTLMVGLPGSGKSTIAKQFEGVIVSTDNIREELNGDASIQDNNNLVFEIAYNRIKDNLEKGNDVIFDAINIDYKRRIDIINKFKKYHAYIQAVFVYATYEECLERNKKRERQVPEEVIKRMYMNFYVPQFFEGFDAIYIKDNSSKMYLGILELEKTLSISQDNPNHTLNVFEHCVETYSWLMDNRLGTSKSSMLEHAGLLHDCGKPFCKTFVNFKGETIENAHFYGHEKVGAYDSIFYTGAYSLHDRLYIAQLIQWHMLLHDKNLSEKTIQKYKNKFGEKFWEDLKRLHEADLAAH